MSVGDKEALVREVEELNAQYLRAIQRVTMPEWLDLELTTAQLKTLLVLNNDSPMTIGQVREQLEVTLPTASHLVDKLVRMNLAARHEDPDDRRRMVTNITDEGRERIRRLRRGHREVLHSWFTTLDETELEGIRASLQALVRVSQAGPPTTSSAPSSPVEPEPVGSAKR